MMVIAGAPALGSGEMGMWLTPRNTPLLRLCYHTKFDHSSSTVGVYVWRSLGNEPFAPHISGSLSVIGTDADHWAIYDFLVVIHSNHEPVSYRNGYNGNFG